MDVFRYLVLKLIFHGQYIYSLYVDHVMKNKEKNMFEIIELLIYFQQKLLFLKKNFFYI